MPLKDYDYTAEVEITTSIVNIVANANYRGADEDWYVKSDNIVLLPQGQPKR
nr:MULTISPECIES: hypothetical protein [Lachnospiraceae]